jgi:hypothetical protein
MSRAELASPRGMDVAAEMEVGEVCEEEDLKAICAGETAGGEYAGLHVREVWGLVGDEESAAETS